MCELFAMSARQPAEVSFSLEEFSRHGGLDGPHKDGWGVAWYEGADVRLVKEPLAARSSACLGFIQNHPFRSSLVVSHIRKATQGGLTLANSQPFVRELGGCMHVFAHNGDLGGALLRSSYSLGTYRPVGETDSEYAFCAMLGRLSRLWRKGNLVPPLTARFALITEFAASLRTLGPANFLYADGDALFAHGHKRWHADGIRPPGLHLLRRTCAGGSGAFTTGGLSIASTSDVQDIALVASVPLTSGEPWRELGEGEIIAISGGRIVSP
ncbi:MAG: class II glutamine amidotransferase [Paralcaligenes sp.]